MSGLATYQRAFQARVLTFAHGVEASLDGTERADFNDRLDAYVLGYRARLIEALGITYPVLKVMLGDDDFERTMRDFIDATPSMHTSVRYYGAKVPILLSRRQPGESGRALAELASWEWTLAEVFDAPDDVPLDATSLANLSPEVWPTLSFAFRASMRRVQTHTNAVTWWRAAQDLCDRPPRLADAPEIQWLLWRRGTTPRFRSLEPLEARVLEAAVQGADFGTLCVLIADHEESTQAALRAATYLRTWIDDELIAGFVTGRTSD